MTSTARSVALVIMTMLLVTLAGCSAIEKISKSIDANTVAVAPPAPKIKPKRVIPPPPRPKPMAALAAKQEDPPPDQPPDALQYQPQYDPQLLIVLKPSQAIASLGNPVSVLERSPSIVWHYNVKDYALDLFFYMDLGDNAFRVLAYDMETGMPSDVAGWACLGHFRASADDR